MHTPFVLFPNTESNNVIFVAVVVGVDGAQAQMSINSA